jgi:hypothetical protein
MRRLRKSKTKPDISKLKYEFYVLDTETTSLEPQPKNFVFGVIYGYHFSKVLYSCEQFIDELEKDRYKGKIIFAHNAEFDLLTIFGNIYTEVDNQAIFNNKFISAKYKYITFADSMNIYPASVAKIGELLGIEKIENEKVKSEGLTKANMTERDIRYCKRDCQIIFLALLKMFEEIGAIKMTISSLSMYLFRNKYLPDEISFSEIVDEFYESYYGGRTEAFRIGSPRGAFKTPQGQYYAKVYDINSMYPYVMTRGKFPDIKHLHKETKIDVRYLLYLLQGYEGLAKVKIRHKNTYFGFLPVKTKINGSEKLVFPVGTFETTVNFNELRFALKHKAVEILSADYVVYGNPIDSPFIDFINDVYAKRCQVENPLDRMIYKLLMNALYGRFAMRMKLTTTYYNDFPLQVIEELESSDKFYDIQIFNTERDDCYLLTENEKFKNSFFSIPTFSSYITSEARIMLLENLLTNSPCEICKKNECNECISQSKKNNVVYCDTDSIFLSSDFMGNISDELGSFKIEPKRIIEISGLKNYRYINENGEEIETIKGISKTATKIIGVNGKAEYHIKKYYKTKQSLRQNKESGESYIMIKKLIHEYDKRKVLPGGETEPIILTD